MNIDQDVNRPKLKKIKRPINRTQPVASNQSYNGSSGSPEFGVQEQNNIASPQQVQSMPSAQKSQVQVSNSKELNEYLDGNINTNDKQYFDDNSYPNYINEEEYYSQARDNVPEWLNTKIFIMSIIMFLLLGVVAGNFLFSQSTVVHNGLQGVVINSEVPRGRARCGIAERSQGCVLYIMNPQRQDMTAKDFYDMASQMTGRQRFMIETGNMRYANSRIKPGDIAQLNIPPL